MTRWLDQRLYPGEGEHWDDQAFRERILAHLQDRPMDLLELGAGAGRVEQMHFKGIARSVTGLDPDPRVEGNPHLDEGRVGVAEAIPWPDASFDLVFACNVLEHLERPEEVFEEVRRVLKPGGVFLAKTPNRWHYVPTIANLTPHRFHDWVSRRRGREAGHTFPTRYRANTRRAIRTLARSARFSAVSFDLIEGRPEYMRTTAFTYVLGWAYERMVNLVPVLRPFRVVLIAELRR